MTLMVLHSLEAVRHRSRIGLPVLIFLLALGLAFARHATARENSAPAPVAVREQRAGPPAPLLLFPLIAGPLREVLLQR